MKSGVIGLVDGNGQELESFEKTNEKNDEILKACVEILRSQTSYRNNLTIQFGRAAIEKPTTQDSINIFDGSISVSESTSIETLYTEFIFVPGEFTVVSNGSGTFAFDLFTTNLPGVDVDRGKIDLNPHVESVPEGVPWQVGFYGNVGEAEKGTIYGDNVLRDERMGPVVQSSQKNQIGLTIENNSETIKYTITESGYIEIYQPSNYEEQEFTAFIQDHVLPYAYKE
jgi:hypothetical protein